MTSIAVLAPVSFYHDVNSLGSNSDRSNNAATPSTLPASFKAVDAKRNIIENNTGVNESEMIVISGYSDSTYSTKLRCSVDLVPMYCDGSPFALFRSPPGKHTFTIEEPGAGTMIVRSFSWTESPSNR